MGRKFIAQYVNKNGLPCMMEKRKTNSLSGHVSELGLCPICRLHDYLTRHHLRPRQVSGVATDASGILNICHACHKFLHKTFANEVLEATLFSLDLIVADQQVKQYVKLRLKEATSGSPSTHYKKENNGSTGR